MSFTDDSGKKLNLKIQIGTLPPFISEHPWLGIKLQTYLLEVNFWSDIITDWIPEGGNHRVCARVCVVDGYLYGIMPAKCRRRGYRRWERLGGHIATVNTAIGQAKAGPLAARARIHDTQAPGRKKRTYKGEKPQEFQSHCRNFLEKWWGVGEIFPAYLKLKENNQFRCVSYLEKVQKLLLYNFSNVWYARALHRRNETRGRMPDQDLCQ